MSKVQIKDIAKIVNGSTPSTKKADYYDGDIVWITPKDLSDQNRKYIYKGERSISRAGYNSCSTEMIPKNNILMSSRAPIGLLSINKVECCTNQGFKSFIVDKTKCDVEYLYYYLKIHIKEIEALGSGTTFKEVSKASIEKYEIDLPDLKIQKRISSILTDIDKKIIINKDTNTQLESLTKTLYDYWFLQFEFPNEEGKPYKSSGGKMVWNEVLKREIPDGWDVKKLGDLFETERGVSYSTPDIAKDSGTPMLNLATFNPGGGSYKADGLKYFSGNYPENKVLHPYDLIMCNTQQTAIDFKKDIIGRAMLVPDVFSGDVISSHHVNAIRTDDDLKFYLLYLFNSDFFHKYISGYTNGTNILGLSFSGVENYFSEIPEPATLKRFANIAQTIASKESEIIKENQQLSSLRDWLLPMLMNGQVTFEKKER